MTVQALVALASYGLNCLRDDFASTTNKDSMTLTRFQSKATKKDASESNLSQPTIHVVTFGCQMNKYDSLLAEGRFRKHGYRVAESIESADVVMFNTCSVRDHAEERAFSWVGELKRAKASRPDLVIGVMGCMAQRMEEQVFGRANHIDLVVGTRSFDRLPEMVAEVRARRANPELYRPKEMRVLDTGTSNRIAVDREGETYTGGLHGWLAVMRGCDLNCTYCIVPTTRGRVQSRAIEDLVREARWMVAGGARAITLLGQTVNSYGEDLPKPAPGSPLHSGRQGRPSLADLLDALVEIDGLKRIRMVTSHPSYVTEALAEAMARSDKIERFLPLPLQSGSDSILKSMKRGYNNELYRKRIEILKSKMPDIELASDWIVGFPGETEADIAASEQRLAEYNFAVNYIFKYDPRPGTKSAEGEDEISVELKKERNQRLLAASERAGRIRHAAHIGHKRQVFVESVSDKHPGDLRGKTEHGLLTSFAGDAGLVGEIVEVQIEEASAFGLGGQLVEPAKL